MLFWNIDTGKQLAVSAISSSLAYISLWYLAPPNVHIALLICLLCALFTKM